MNTEILQMYRSGLSVTAIARWCGTTEDDIRTTLRSMGVVR